MLQLGDKSHNHHHHEHELLPNKSFQMNKQDNKCVSRLISKETSIVNSSCRVYYGEAAAVPFEWESQPGTPKHTLSETTLPPLTPPPSYSTPPYNSNISIMSPNISTKFFRKSRKLQSLSWSSVSSVSSSSLFSSASLNSSLASTHNKKVKKLTSVFLCGFK